MSELDSKTARPDRRIACEFFLVRYVPDVVRGEFVNIGVLLREAGRPESARVRFTRDWARVRCVDPLADTESFEAFEGELRKRLAEEGQPVMRTMDESFSQMLQLTTMRHSLAESMTAEMELLMGLYVENRKRETVARRSARMTVQGRMRMEFERAGVWELMRKRIAAAEYTRPGDPLRIDCGYRNGKLRMFHAVAPETDAELAKVLAFSVTSLAKGVKEKEGAELELTAIVPPFATVEGEPEREDQYRFAVETMEAQQIRVLTTERLPLVAETARRELRI